MKLVDPELTYQNTGPEHGFYTYTCASSKDTGPHVDSGMKRTLKIINSTSSNFFSKSCKLQVYWKPLFLAFKCLRETKIKNLNVMVSVASRSWVFYFRLVIFSCVVFFSNSNFRLSPSSALYIYLPPQRIINHLRANSHSCIYSASMPPPVAQQIISVMSSIMGRDGTLDGTS